MELTDLTYFREAAKYGNLTTAAEKLYVSQPGLSKSLSRLEGELGVPLFDRRKGKIELNSYGQIFLANVELLFSQLENGVEAVRQAYNRDQNILSISCSISDFLIDTLKVFSPLYPHIAIRQYPYIEDSVAEQLLRRNLDLIICSQPLENTKIDYMRLSACPFVLLCHVDHPLAEFDSIHLEQAKGYPFICESTRFNRKRLEQLCQLAGFTPRIGHEIENSYILFNLLNSNAGIALVPFAHYLQINAHFPHHALKLVRLEDDNLPLSEIGVAYPKDGQLSLSCRQFIDHLILRAEAEKKEMGCF